MVIKPPTRSSSSISHRTRSLLVVLLMGAAVATIFMGLFMKPSAFDIRGQEYQPTIGWRTAAPEAHGFDSAKLAEGLLAIQEKRTLIHSLTILRNDALILDAYFYPYDGSIYHDLTSVTKSVITTLIGIAADQGKLQLDDPVLSFFPARDIAHRDERKERITVRHLASMSSGLACIHEPDEPTLRAMRASPDWVQFALDLPMAYEPGTRFVYNSPGMHLLSAILQKATGMTALEFARENLFGPLDIQDVYWPADHEGVTHGWGDLCLHSHDMAKLGLLYLHQGKWDGKQIVSREWVESAVQVHMTGTKKAEDYGYGWWVSPEKKEPAFFSADGNGGQRILVVPEMNLVLVSTGGGFTLDEIMPYVVAAMSSTENSLPANPTGVANLNAALAAIAHGPEPQPIPPLPASANAISGQTFVFDSNSDLLSLRLSFDASAEAILQLAVANEPSPRVIGVGLDGVYRPSHAGRPIIARGNWADEQTFVIDYNEGPGIAIYELCLHFIGDKMIIEVPGLGSFEANQK